MTTYFISRHPGAVAWINTQGLAIDQVLAHLDVALIQPGDCVIGSLPVNLAAQVCAAGASYWHLSLELPLELRGRELTSADLQQWGATLQRFQILSIG